MNSKIIAAARHEFYCAAFAMLAGAAAVPAAAATFNVNSPADVSDKIRGDGHCETAVGNGVCTVRAAIEEANALAGADTISLQTNTVYYLSLAAPEADAQTALIVSDSVTIVGNGSTLDAGSSRRVFGVDGCIGGLTNPDSSCVNGKLVAVVSGVTFQHGSTTFGTGAGIGTGAMLTLTHCVVTANQVTTTSQFGGGGIFNSGTLTLIDSVVSDNTISGADGGGIYNYGSVTIQGSTIRDNQSTDYGGGLGNSGNAVVRDSTFTGNHAASGGAIASQGMSISNSTISGNFSDGSGGGIATIVGTIKLFNTTVTDNLANADDTGSAWGGGIAGKFTLNNSIVQGNLRSDGANPFPTLVNDECSGTITSSGPNLMSADVDAAHCTVTGGYAVGAANFGPLANNGGNTRTHALLDGSAAIDTGNVAGCTDDLGAPLNHDQRDVPRPYGARCDLGAFEAAEIIFRDGFDGS